MAATEHYGLQKPDEARFANEEFVQLQLTLDQIDAIMWTLQQSVNGKAALDHIHQMAQVQGLSAALDGKMPATRTFALDDLTDVDGAAAAAVGYVLVKSALGWVPASPAAAIGAHQHPMSDITGLSDALATKAAANVIPIGTSIFWNSATLPVGYLKENGAAISRSAYPELFAVIGTTFGAGDGSTTFNLPDSRAEFIRGLDDGRGVDTGRTLGSAQASQNLAHVHGITDPAHQHTVGWNVGPSGANFDQNITNVSVASNSGPTSRTTSAAVTGITINSSGGAEARPRNVAKLILIRAF